MAETTKTAASRTLNFGLGKDVMDRVKEAGRTTGKDRATGIGQAISDVAGTASKGLTDFISGQKELAKKKEESLNAWEEGFENAESRNSWASDGLFGKFQDLENTKYKEEYLQAINDGDQQLAQKLLKQMDGRSSKLQAWKASVENAQSLYKDDNWDFQNMTDEEKAIVNVLNNQADGDYNIEWDDKGNMVFDIGGNKVDLKKYNDIVARSIKPVAVQKAFLAIQDQYVGQGEDLRQDFDEERVRQELSSGGLINRDNLRSVMYNSIDGGGSFAKDFEHHPDMMDIKYESLFKPFDTDNEPGLSQEEFTALSSEDKQKIIQALHTDSNNYDLAEMLVVDWMTKKTKANFNKGRTKRTENPELYGKYDK
jgi:hypothetical protein